MTYNTSNKNQSENKEKKDEENRNNYNKVIVVSTDHNITSTALKN